ncbi:hypothetical protein SEUCBS139899_001372 [Sporothrix eucalyptigena]
MAPEKVRTVPPWVLQRPPQSRHPQHNHAPSEPQQRSSSGPQQPPKNDDAGADDAPNDGPAMSGAQNTILARAVDGAIDPVGPVTTGKEASPDRSIGQRLSHLFQSKEGRKWDHLRSSEPVIVPQFHVVNRPFVSSFDDDGEPRIEERRRSMRATGRNGESSRQAAMEAMRAGRGSSSRSPLSSTVTGAGLAPLSASTSAKASGAAPQNAPSAQNPPSAAHARYTWWYNPDSQWRRFIQSSEYPKSPNEKSEVITDEEMARLNPDFGYNSVIRPKVGGGDGGGGVGHFRDGHHGLPRYSDRAFYERIWQTLLHHPLGPLACRLTVLMTSIVALIIAVTIFRRENLGAFSSSGNGDRPSNNLSSMQLADLQQERSQIIVAIVVDVVAIPYIGYITVDDYTGKPLGLRPVNARIRLILTDLVFIIFKSASTALGFESMIFFNTEKSQGLLRALGSFELIGLVSWALTLTINIFREVARLGG